jgi:hypothetical protein
VFLGYSSLHKGFKCLEPSSGRVYISHDVVFDENVFPFSEMHSNAGAHLRQEILLLPNHLLNPGDAISGPDVTDDQPGSSSSSVLQDSTKNSKENDASRVQIPSDNGVFFQPPPGAASQADTPAPAEALGGVESQADFPAVPRAARGAPATAPSPSAPTSPSLPRLHPPTASTHGGTPRRIRLVRLVTSTAAPPRLEDLLRLVQHLKLLCYLQHLKLLCHLQIFCLHHLKLSALEPVCKVV